MSFCLIFFYQFTYLINYIAVMIRATDINRLGKKTILGKHAT